ncbi:MAG: DUF1638 domain-containing protein [Rubellimicrobium sp.]|nr:DUF1638 domain-containing protein [Rubellimicrobium sp.]
MATPPGDAALTEVGLAPQGAGRILVIACGALAREVIAIRDANAMTHLDLQCLPAILHNHPDRIPPLIEAAVEAARGRYETVFVAYADCGTGGLLRETCDRLGVGMIAGPHCYSFFEGNETFAAHGEGATFWLTDFLARQFDAFVIRPLGLDRHPELRDLYFGNYERLVYLAQTDDPALTQAAERAAERLGLRFERRRTGFGDLGPAIGGLR